MEVNRMVTRREFLKSITALFLSSLVSPFFPQKSEAVPLLSPQKSKIAVIHGTDKAKLIDSALDAFGGINAFVKRGDRVVIKPNAAWSRTPEEGANVHPELLIRLINLCFEAGAKDVRIVEHSCDNYKSAFEINGMKAAVAKTKGTLVPLAKGGDFLTVPVPKGRVLSSVKIAREIREADVYINMPIAKTHGSATLTLGMKNHMGAIEDRWFFHRNDLHQCIADVSTVLSPSLTIMDATRILLTNGPKGPGEVRVVNKVVAGIDQVALDSYAATLFGMQGSDIKHIRAAYDHGIGEIDLTKVDIEMREV
jgi:uncharacterized protein (DUF362 family)